MRVIIVGLGDLGTELAETLSNKREFELVLIDQDEDKCEALSDEYDALVLQGDGTDPEILESGGAGEANALVATTHSDAMNIIVAVLGKKKFSVPQAVAKLNNPSLRTTAQELGMDHVVFPSFSASTEIVSLLKGHDVLDFSLLVQGGAKLIEISPGRFAGKKIKQLDLPKRTLIAAIFRDGAALIPQGGTELKEEDVLVIITEDEKKEEQIKDLLGELKLTTTQQETDGVNS